MPGDSACPAPGIVWGWGLIFLISDMRHCFSCWGPSFSVPVFCELLPPGIQFIHVSIHGVLSSIPCSWKAFTKSLLNWISYIKKKILSSKLEPGTCEREYWKTSHGRRRAKNTFSLKCWRKLPMDSRKDSLQGLWLPQAEVWPGKHVPSRDHPLPTLGKWQDGVECTLLCDSADLASSLPDANSVTSREFLNPSSSRILTCKMRGKDPGKTLRPLPACTSCAFRCSYVGPGSWAHPHSLLEKKERKKEKKNTSIKVFIAQPVTMNHGIINSLLCSCLALSWCGHSQARPSSSFIDRHGIFLVISHGISSEHPDWVSASSRFL